MKYLKEVYNDFKVVPFKKFMTFLFIMYLRLCSNGTIPLFCQSNNKMQQKETP